MNELGTLRPSQLIYTFGVGALLDLPNISALILGLDDWNTQYCQEIAEDRLLGAIQRRFGAQVKKLFLPPLKFDDDNRDPMAAAVGVPVAPFPRWLRCPVCDTLSTIDSGVFQLVQDRWRPDKTGFVHASCAKSQGSPPALPVRFLVACREGHLSDFPWVDYVHQQKPACKPARLTLREFGAAGDASDIIVKCLECTAEQRMADAFDREKFLIPCAGHHPHLRRVESERCQEQARTILLGASNSWFPLVMSALSLPPLARDRLGILVTEQWATLKDLPTFEVAQYVTAPSRFPSLAEFSADQIWEAIQNRRQTTSQGEVSEETDLKIAEWKVLTQNPPPTPTRDFRVTRAPAPQGFESHFQETILLERLREVRALLAFTRVESKGDFADAAYVDDGRQTALSRQSSTWFPASEIRGEGLFLTLNEARLQAWEQRPDIRQLEQEFLLAHKAWRKLRKQSPPEAGYPGIRFVLLHSLSHGLMRQIALECGYTAASMRERLYCRSLGDEHGPMAGILIYTAASDSEGTLGGLVQLGQPITLGRHLQHALESMRICGSDPLCAEHAPVGDGLSVHGACCHACLFAPETSCERGNRFLDRTTLVGTFAERALEFFDVV